MKRLLFGVVATIAVVSAALAQASDKSSNQTSSTSKYTALENAICRRIRELQYTEKDAKTFIEMIRPWQCDKMQRELEQASQDFRKHKISKDQYAQAEEVVAGLIAQKIHDDIAVAKICPKGDRKYSYLTIFSEEKKANSYGLAQAYCVLSNSLGLHVEAVNAVEPSCDRPSTDEMHTACLVRLENGKFIQVDLILKDFLSKPYEMSENYEKRGAYWWIQKDKKKQGGLHFGIQQLGEKGLLAAVLFNRSFDKLNAGKLEDAKEIIDEIIKINSNIAEIYYLRSMAYQFAGKISEAIAEYTKAIEKNPKYAMALATRASLLPRSKFADALEDCNEAVKLAPNNAEIRNYRGLVYHQSQKEDEALADFNKALEIDPDCFNGYNNRAVVYMGKKKYTEALADFSKGIELKPTFATTYINRSTAYLLLGKKKEAAKDLQTALKIDPKWKPQIQAWAKASQLDLEE